MWGNPHDSHLTIVIKQKTPCTSVRIRLLLTILTESDTTLEVKPMTYVYSFKLLSESEKADISSFVYVSLLAMEWESTPV